MRLQNAPRLIVAEGAAESKWREHWNSLTQEQRRQMSVPELIEAMGPLHCSHRDYKERPHSLLPMPNLAGRQPVVQGFDAGLIGHWRALLRVLWA